MSTISAIIITKNEEAQIKRCLDSIKDFVDEIIIIDDCSTDKTVEICKSYGAKIIINESGGNFDRQRNLGIENAKGEWILQLDADEIVPQDTAKKIKEAINRADDFVAFKLRRKNFLFNYPLKYGGSYIFGVKILKKGKACYIGNKIHETLSVDGKIGVIDADIYHYPFTSISKIIEKNNFYSTIEANAFLEKNQAVSIKEIKYRLTFKAIKLFLKFYFKKKAYKDGIYGLIWSIINVLSTQFYWLKIFEKALKEGKLKDL